MNQPEAHVLRPAGEIDRSNAGELMALVSQALASGGPVVIDLSHVRFIDASVLNSLATCRNEWGDGSFSLIAPEGSVPRRILEIAGLDQIIRIEPPIVRRA